MKECKTKIQKKSIPRVGPFHSKKLVPLYKSQKNYVLEYGHVGYQSLSGNLTKRLLKNFSSLGPLWTEKSPKIGSKASFSEMLPENRHY